MSQNEEKAEGLDGWAKFFAKLGKKGECDKIKVGDLTANERELFDEHKALIDSANELKAKAENRSSLMWANIENRLNLFTAKLSINHETGEIFRCDCKE